MHLSVNKKPDLLPAKKVFNIFYSPHNNVVNRFQELRCVNFLAPRCVDFWRYAVYTIFAGYEHLFLKSRGGLAGNYDKLLNETK